MGGGGGGGCKVLIKIAIIFNIFAKSQTKNIQVLAKFFKDRINSCLLHPKSLRINLSKRPHNFTSIERHSLCINGLLEALNSNMICSGGVVNF